jgi:hypothetical protein
MESIPFFPPLASTSHYSLAILSYWVFLETLNAETFDQNLRNVHHLILPIIKWANSTQAKPTDPSDGATCLPPPKAIRKTTNH